jgi:phospholipid/cholesterol/gamma-HCH transport system substrate-binding protein
MEETRRNIWVGITVLVGLGLLGTLIVLFGRGPTMLTRGGTYPLHIHFDWVVDVRPGNLVNVKGITVGRVVDVGLRDRKRFDAGVDVVVAIENAYWLPEGTRAKTTEPMLGQGRPPIELIPGPTENDPLPPNASIEGTVQKALDSIFPRGVVGTFEHAARQIGDAAAALTPVLEEMEDLLRQRSPAEVDRSVTVQGNLSTAVARLDATLRHFNEVLGDPEVKSALRDTVSNVHDMSVKGKAIMSDIEVAAGDAQEMIAEARQVVGRVDGAVENLDARTARLTAELTATLDELDVFLGHLNVVGQQVAGGEGSVGRLLMEDKLYESLRITAERLALAVDDFRGLIAEWREGKVRVAF